MMSSFLQCTRRRDDEGATQQTVVGYTCSKRRRRCFKAAPIRESLKFIQSATAVPYENCYEDTDGGSSYEEEGRPGQPLREGNASALGLLPGALLSPVCVTVTPSVVTATPLVLCMSENRGSNGASLL